MSYYKKCICGYINRYETVDMAPRKCPKCTRPLLHTPEMVDTGEMEETPSVDGPSPDKPSADTTSTDELSAGQEKTVQMALVFPNGETLPVNEEITVGRNCAGADYLENYLEVSREHFVIAPRPTNIGARITDVSSFGTFVNGKKLHRNIAVTISNGACISLSGTDKNKVHLTFIIERK